MQTVRYYFIKAKRSLLDQVGAWEDWDKEFVETTQCWEHKGARSEDSEVKAKMAFLIDVVTEHGSEKLISLLGGKPISEKTFDLWWSIEGHDLYANLDGSESGCIEESMVEYTGSVYVNNWLKTRVRNA